MLDENFEDQMNEIIRLCPVKRQTMLFSATMTDKVGEVEGSCDRKKRGASWQALYRCMGLE